MDTLKFLSNDLIFSASLLAIRITAQDLQGDIYAGPFLISSFLQKLFSTELL